jgi:hypothetical protein
MRLVFTWEHSQKQIPHCTQLVAHPSKPQLLMYGGESYDGQDCTTYNELLSYDINKRGACVCVCVCVYSGHDPCVHVVAHHHTTTNHNTTHHHAVWKKIASPGQPAPRNSHACVPTQTQLFFFGWCSVLCVWRVCGVCSVFSVPTQKQLFFFSVCVYSVARAVCLCGVCAICV